MRLQDGGFLALSTREPRGEETFADRCLIRWMVVHPFRSNVLQPGQGIFRDLAGGQRMTSPAANLWGPGIRDMNRYPVMVTSNGMVVVDTRGLIWGRRT